VHKEKRRLARCCLWLAGDNFEIHGWRFRH
jgi:hypothetical protein